MDPSIEDFSVLYFAEILDNGHGLLWYKFELLQGDLHNNLFLLPARCVIDMGKKWNRERKGSA